MTCHATRKAAIITFAAGLLACRGPLVPASASGTLAIDTTNLVARGEYIVRNAAACGGCHSTDERNPDGPLGGGTEFKDWRLGTIRAANLTPDSATGLGTWTDDDIVRALRSGQRKDGRLLAPVMPYDWLHRMSDGDALAVAQYLKSLPAVRHEVRQSPNLVFKIARLFMAPKEPVTVWPPARGPTAAYGNYLADHVALCAHCHTPRSGIRDRYDDKLRYAGDASPPKEFPVNPSNITPDSATGIGRWTEEDFLRTMRTGVDPAGDTLHPIMPWRAIRRMTDDDLRAMYLYLRTVPAVHHDVTRR
jgi:mono/diheme cytochrome c family protein